MGLGSNIKDNKLVEFERGPREAEVEETPGGQGQEGRSQAAAVDDDTVREDYENVDERTSYFVTILGSKGSEEDQVPGTQAPAEDGNRLEPKQETLEEVKSNKIYVFIDKEGKEKNLHPWK